MDLKMRFIIASIIAIIMLLIVGDSIGICGKIGLVLACAFIAYIMQVISNIRYESKTDKKRRTLKKGETR